MQMEMTKIYGRRIEQARKIAGYTQKILAEKVGVLQSDIALYENERIVPPIEVIEAIGRETGFLHGFFTTPSMDDFPMGSLSYRALRSVSAKDQERAYLNAKLMYEHICVMSRSFVLPRLNVPPALRERPATCAQLTRASLGLSPDTPVRNLTGILERNGTVIFSLSEFFKKIDAFSTWVELQGKRPVIVESSGRMGDRIRFNIAHELGHLVMHHPAKSSIKLMEKEANEFAAEFLMPKSSILQDLTTPISLLTVAQLKPKWGVSMQALIYRAHELNVISDRQSTYLFTQMASRGWRMREPSNLDVAIEAPQLFRKMVEGLYGGLDEYAISMGMNETLASRVTLFA